LEFAKLGSGARQNNSQIMSPRTDTQKQADAFDRDLYRLICRALTGRDADVAHDRAPFSRRAARRVRPHAPGRPERNRRMNRFFKIWGILLMIWFSLDLTGGLRVDLVYLLVHVVATFWVALVIEAVIAYGRWV
jgi:hypothetical protein